MVAYDGGLQVCALYAAAASVLGAEVTRGLHVVNVGPTGGGRPHGGSGPARLSASPSDRCCLILSSRPLVPPRPSWSGFVCSTLVSW